MHELIRKLAEALGLAPQPQLRPIPVRVPAKSRNDFLQGRK
ncbi:PA1414 family protein [Pseudooceanicola sp. 502str34]